MSSNWGRNIKISIFGESHSKAIGVVVDGLPSGLKLDEEFIRDRMSKRAPVKSAYSTARNEKDAYEIESGFFNGYTTGTPLCAVIKNSDRHSKDYDELKIKPRPSHADYTGMQRYGGFNDYRGGGHFSGRLTAPLVFAGAVCEHILREKGITVGAHIYSIGEACDKPFDENLTAENLKNLMEDNFPVLDESAKEKMRELVAQTKENGDSIGGVIECCALGLPAGMGDPMFEGAESIIASMLFGVPAVKGVEFGKGFEISKMLGSAANDGLEFKNGEITYSSNNNGGILGGITNGMPLIVRAAIKPTPSISKEQNTVDLSKKENSKLIIKGRHDSCIVPRAAEVVRAAVCVCLADMVLESRKNA